MDEISKKRLSCNWSRREFLKLSAAAAFGSAFSSPSVMAGSVTREDFEHLVPANKKLSPEWLKTLYERGNPLNADIYLIVKGAALKCYSISFLLRSRSKLAMVLLFMLEPAGIRSARDFRPVRFGSFRPRS